MIQLFLECTLEVVEVIDKKLEEVLFAGLNKYIFNK